MDRFSSGVKHPRKSHGGRPATSAREASQCRSVSYGSRDTTLRIVRTWALGLAPYSIQVDGRKITFFYDLKYSSTRTFNPPTRCVRSLYRRLLGEAGAPPAGSVERHTGMYGRLSLPLRKPPRSPPPPTLLGGHPSKARRCVRASRRWESPRETDDSPHARRTKPRAKNPTSRRDTPGGREAGEARGLEPRQQQAWR